MDYLIDNYDKPKMNKSAFQQQFILIILIGIVIINIIYQFLPMNIKNEGEQIYYQILFAWFWVKIHPSDSIENIFDKNCNSNIQNETCKYVISKNYFGENEFEKFYDYCKWKEYTKKIYCGESAYHFKNIEQQRILFMEKEDDFQEDDKQIIYEINNLINN